MPEQNQAPSLLPWQKGLWQQIQKRRIEDKYPHALLLSGPAGVGKQQFGAMLAKSLVCEADSITQQPCGHCKSCSLVDAGSHPDVFWLEPEEAGKTIRIDAVRGLSQKSVLTTHSQNSRVFIVSPADAMNQASSNALLKTLEEPTSATAMILISSQPHKLPATIRSRCQTLSFKAVDTTQTESWLADRIDSSKKAELIALTGGAPLQIIKAKEEQWLENAVNLISDLEALKARKTNPIQIANNWNGQAPERILGDLSRICSDLIHLLSSKENTRLYIPSHRDRLQSLSKGINLQQLYFFMDELNQLRRQMGHNLNMQMLLETLVINWLSLTRPEAR